MQTGLVGYPMPLSDKRFAFVYLPTVTTKADIDRIVAILRTLEPDTQVGTGNHGSMEPASSLRSEAP